MLSACRYLLVLMQNLHAVFKFFLDDGVEIQPVASVSNVLPDDGWVEFGGLFLVRSKYRTHQY